MLMSTLFGVASSLLSLFYTGLQVMVPCLPPAPLSTAVITTDEYMGSWYLVATTAWDEDDLKSFKDLDSSVIYIQKGDNKTLMVTESARLGDQCHQNTRSFYTWSALDPFLFRTDFDNIALIWDGKLINCPSCIIILVIDENEEARASLFARDGKTPDEVVQEFKSKMDCVYMEYFLKAPLKNGYCKLEFDEAP